MMNKNKIKILVDYKHSRGFLRNAIKYANHIIREIEKENDKCKKSINKK